MLQAPGWNSFDDGPDMRHGIFLFSVCVLSVVAFALPAMALKVTPEEVLRAAGSGFDRAAFDHGEIVWAGLGDYEKSERELVAVMAVQLPAPLSEVVHVLANDEALQMGRSLPVDQTVQWNAVEKLLQTTLEAGELKRMQGEAPQKSFNLSSVELERLLAAESDVRSLAKAWRALLWQRQRDYRNQGLAALAPYQRVGKKDVEPGAQLIQATESMVFLRKKFPAFIESLANYPQRDPHLQERFFFTLERERGRPLYILEHWLVQADAEHALIAERQFYLSHSLDSLQVIILCLPYRGGTLVAMLNQTYTGHVSGMGRAIAHRIGRSKVRDKILPLFQALQQRFDTVAAR